MLSDHVQRQEHFESNLVLNGIKIWMNLRYGLVMSLKDMGWWNTQQFAITVWTIWNGRNRVIFEGQKRVIFAFTVHQEHLKINMSILICKIFLRHKVIPIVSKR